MKILVPLAHHPGSLHVAEYAGALAVGLGAGITLLHVYEPPNSMVGIVPGATVAGELVVERDAGRRLLDTTSVALAKLGVGPVDTVLERDASPHHAIVEHARGFDLIVMGTHARSGMSRLLMGSVATHVLRDAPCPVITVHL